MRYDRRRFLAGVGAAVLGLMGLAVGDARGSARRLFVSCGADHRGNYVVARLGGNGSRRFEQPLPARGHGVAFHPDQFSSVVFARRPGDFAVVLESETGAVLKWIQSTADRHFYGHGTFSVDGRYLFATENHYNAGRGVLGVYDADDGYARIGEFSSYGVGPHDVRLMPGGDQLVVANGGIRTHPEQGRAKLNIATMDPNLAVLDARTGSLLELARLPKNLHKLSIRHLDITRDGCVAVAMQYEGDRRDRTPLVGLYQAGGTIRLLHAPRSIERRMRHYTGSIAFDAGGSVFAVSSPRGHLATFWDAGTGAYLFHIEAVDASGIAPCGRDGEFLITGGNGAIRLVDTRMRAASVVAETDGQFRWDNHVGRCV